jgi:hypothetical protein
LVIGLIIDDGDDACAVTIGTWAFHFVLGVMTAAWATKTTDFVSDCDNESVVWVVAGFDAIASTGQARHGIGVGV